MAEIILALHMALSFLILFAPSAVASTIQTPDHNASCAMAVTTASVFILAMLANSVMLLAAFLWLNDRTWTLHRRLCIAFFIAGVLLAGWIMPQLGC